jgi:hypothetical protein
LTSFLIFNTYSHNRWLNRSTNPSQSDDRRRLETV